MIKRLFDIIFSMLGLIILSPVLFLIALIIVLDSGTPVFYLQTRVGKDSAHYSLIKFRSMTSDSSGLKITVNNDSRITPSGKVLRKYKLDELPQLINILIGDMSFVGPRPEVQKYVSYYSKNQLNVLTVKPGLTGLDSLNFTNEQELLENKENPEDYYIKHIMPKKLELSLEYIKKRSFWIDIQIIIKTVGKGFF